MNAGSEFSARDFRDALGNFASGITVITSLSADGEPLGLTCQSFFSVSLDPPLVAFCVACTSKTYPLIQRTGRFAVNVLAHDQRAISDAFARTATDKWSGVSWGMTPGRCPVVDGVLSWLECTIENQFDAGDHLIVVGRVTARNNGPKPEHRPLLYFRGAYHVLSQQRTTA